MSRTVRSYAIHPGLTPCAWPDDAVVLGLAIVSGHLTLAVEADHDQAALPRKVYAVGAGQSIPGTWRHLATVAAVPGTGWAAYEEVG